MNDIFDLYQEMILDHSRSPKNFGTLSNRSHHACGHNPLCGDMIDIHLLVTREVISDISFSGDGCAISKASASLMTESIKGRSIEHAQELFDVFHTMLTKDSNDHAGLGKLEALKGVRQFPARVKCATLCWHTLLAALNRKTHRITTE